MDEVVNVLEDIDDPLLVEEPDDSVLAQEEPELESLVKEEPLEILDNPGLVMELSEDPVRLYLKEIGGIDLLDTDREFWLASRLDTVRRIEVISRGHPLARKGESKPRSIYRALYDELLTAWKRLEEDSQRLGYPRPDLRAILQEAQELRHTWELEDSSYLRAYLDNGLWGKDPLWDGVARHAFIVFIYLYMLPEQLAEHLGRFIEKNDGLPSARLLVSHLPDDLVLQTELEDIHLRAQEAHHAIIRANLRLVVSVAKRYIGRGSSFPGSDPGRQYRLAAGRFEVRPHARLQVQHLRHLVDPPVDQPLDRRSSAYHPHPGAYLRVDQPAAAHPTQAYTAARPRPLQRGAGPGGGSHGPERRADHHAQ
jgi:RNA polymerase primary sigma factor